MPTLQKRAETALARPRSGRRPSSLLRGVGRRASRERREPDRTSRRYERKERIRADLAAGLGAWLMGARKEKVWSEDAAADAWEADTKNPNAIRLLGVAYERGRGRAANAKMARKMFLKSAMMGDVTAMRYVAGCYFRGVGGGVDYVEAFRWYSSPSGDSDGSRRRRGCHVDYSAETSRGGAAAAAWIFCGDE